MDKIGFRFEYAEEKIENKIKWKRYRFNTKYEDWRPAIYNPSYPSYCSGQAGDSYIMIAWLPEGEDLLKYWDDAEILEEETHDTIKFTDRFPKPEDYVEL